jgi:F-type H+-transporting ATPase subunit epsilon
MAKTTRVTVSKVNEALFDGDAVSVTVPGALGEMTILADHEALITPLKAGRVTVRTKSDSQTFEIEKGVCEISNNQVTVLL